MNTVPKNGLSPDAHRRDFRGPESPDAGEDTLRLIANLPAPEGLADRVKAGLRNAPRAGRILMWRAALAPARGWMYTGVARGAAAAAIVCVVAGGGWRIYSHVQRAGPSANVIVMPAPTAAKSAGFSNSGAIGRPDTLGGTQLKHPVAPVSEVNAVAKMPAQPKAVPAGKAIRKKKAARATAAPAQ